MALRPCPLNMSPRITVFLAICLWIAPDATGQTEKSPSWMENITRLPPGDYAILRPVKLNYVLGWNNRVNAGKFEVSVARSTDKQGRFIGDATGQSSGFARLLYPYDFRARSIINESSLRPINFQLSEKERNSVNSYDIIFESARQVYTTTAKRKDQAATTNTTKFNFDFGQDILSAALYLRTQPLEIGEEISMVVAPFNHPYLAKCQVTGNESRKIKGKTYSTIRLDVEVGKINGDLSIKTYDHIKRTTLWMSNDEYRIPLELQTQISVGFISARLVELKWLE